jgi:hypothetical protein
MSANKGTEQMETDRQTDTKRVSMCVCVMLVNFECAGSGFEF